MAVGSANIGLIGSDLHVAALVPFGGGIDPQLLRSAEPGCLNGHVPVIRILSAIAVLAAVLDERDAVAISNELSASVQRSSTTTALSTIKYSKSEDFEATFRTILSAGPALRPGDFSWLRVGPNCGWACRRGAGAVSRMVLQLQQGLNRTDPAARPLVRAVRQVLLR